MKYIPLNIKTEYDLMNSLIKIDELILYAKNNNINALGVTDSNMFEYYEFITKCNENNIKPIIGIELKIDDKNILLYAKDYEDYISLCKIVSKKNIDKITLEDIYKFNELIVVCNIKDYNLLKDNFKNIYIKYSNEQEKNESLKLTNKIVYMPLIRYYNKEDIEYFKYIKLIENNLTIDDEINIEESYFKENNDSFDIETTYKFIENINIVLPESKRHIPKYNDNSLEFLKALCKKGLEKRLNGNVDEIHKNRLMYELSVIEKMNFVDYFLIVYDFVLFAKKNHILVGPGRGSGAASLVNYSLGIINIDPLKYNLIFERFLNPERITMPDIDIDFDNTKRDNVIEYVSNKYGHNNVSRIISFNTMLPKQIIRDVSKVLKLENTLVDKICKVIKDEKDFEELKNNKEFIYNIQNNNNLKKVVNISSKLCGLKKNTSMHAAGVVISDTPIYNIMPLYKSNNIILTCYSKDLIESLGLLKMDFLSIKNLNTISNIVNEIKENNINIDLDKIPLDDKNVLNIFKNAYTTGIFQFESDGMKSFLKNLQVDDFNTLIDAIALYRPGPRDMIDTYIRRKNNIEKTEYLINELKPILSSTKGIIIYQEQVLEILREIGGYSYSEADIIRRAMSKKKLSIIEKEHERFEQRMLEKGYTKDISDNLYNLIIKFSSYGFNKSHSVVYSLVAYQMAYLKCYYSKYFMKNLLNLNKNSEKLKEYLDESKLLGIEFESISINKSYYDFVVSNNKLVLPFSLIKSIAMNVSEEIVKERENKPFESFYDFLIRCYGKSINKRVVISLIECGVFDEFKLNKKQSIDNIEEILNYVNLCKDLNIIIDEKPIFDEIEDYKDSELTNLEIKNYGFYLSFHPVTKYDRTGFITLENYTKYYDKVIKSILYLENIKTIKTKNNDKMSFIKLSDEFNTVEGVIFKDTYNKLVNIEKNRVYIVTSKIEKRNNTYQFIIYNMEIIK